MKVVSSKLKDTQPIQCRIRVFSMRNCKND